MSSNRLSTTQWPKTPPPLTEEQKVAREKYMQLWHENLPNRYKAIERFNHGWVSALPRPPGCRTLEIGAGLGAHMKWEELKDQEYFCLEMRESFCNQLASTMPRERVICADIQKGGSFADQSFDRIVAIHVLEHLLNLPLALNEIKRLLRPEGFFDIVIPCEGGLAHSLARKLTAERLFRNNFNMDFTPIRKNEHVSEFPEIYELLMEKFQVEKSRYFPLLIPLYQFNFCVGFRFRKR